MMDDMIKIAEFIPPVFMCATCGNNITELRAMKLPICDECIKDLREIIKERRLEKEKDKGQTAFKEAR